MKRMTNSYANALKENAPEVRAIQHEVFAILLRMHLTNEEPRHKACPKGGLLVPPEPPPGTPTSWACLLKSGLRCHV